MNLDEVFEHFEETGDTVYQLDDVMIKLDAITGSIKVFYIDDTPITEEDLTSIRAYDYIWDSEDWVRY
jgi:hypothetical protein